MNRRLISGSSPLFLALAVSLPHLFSASSASAQGKVGAHAKGEFLVRWASQKAPLVLAPNVSPAPWQQQNLRAQVSAKVGGAKVTQTFEGAGWSLVKIPEGSNEEATRAQLAATLGAANVSYNYVRKATALPKEANDPEFKNQWHLNQIKAPDAWNASIGSPNVVIAVLDTGIDLTHPDIKANLWKNPGEIPNNGKDDDKNGFIDDVYGLNGIDVNSPPQDESEQGHGTHCAGLIGAVGNNRVDVTGVCWQVKVMSLKFMQERSGFDDDAIRCIEYAVRMKKRGVNLRAISSSWSGLEDNPALKDALIHAESAGILNICAAGNESTNIDQAPLYPASYNLASIITVGASDSSDNRAALSNYGPKAVDLVAPGMAIRSLKRGGGYTDKDGTSMATPQVAGAVALIAAKEPGLKPKDIKTRILATVDKVPSLSGVVLSGGRLNLHRAVANATMSISGLVYRLDGTTKVPLAGAYIKMSGKLATSTDKNGKYVITDLAPATYKLATNFPGFAFDAATATLPSASGTPGAPNATVDFVATKVPTTLYTLSGYAIDANGNPQKNVPIFLNDAPVAVALTATNGKYIITDRGAGTYQLRAITPNVLWTPSQPSITLPTRPPATGAPHGIIDFKASVPDTTPPVITITTPAHNSRLTPGSLVAKGTAKDASGLQQITFRLTHLDADSYTSYDWVKKIWVDGDTNPGSIGTQSASGNEWSIPLPYLNATSGTYQLRVSGTDVLGNGAAGEAATASNFTVANALKSSQSQAVTAPRVPSGGRS